MYTRDSVITIWPQIILLKQWKREGNICNYILSLSNLYYFTHSNLLKLTKTTSSRVCHLIVKLCYKLSSVYVNVDVVHFKIKKKLIDLHVVTCGIKKNMEKLKRTKYSTQGTGLPLFLSYPAEWKRIENNRNNYHRCKF